MFFKIEEIFYMVEINMFQKIYSLCAKKHDEKPRADLKLDTCVV